MKRQDGFTVIELVTAIIFLLGVMIVAFMQAQRSRDIHHDTMRKTAINAIHYSLEEGFYARHGFYPERIADDTLTTMDVALLTDPAGKKLGDAGSAYHYEPRDCHDGKCKAYTLRTQLQFEGDFIKESRHTN